MANQSTENWFYVQNIKMIVKSQSIYSSSLVLFLTTRFLTSFSYLSMNLSQNVTLSLFKFDLISSLSPIIKHSLFSFDAGFQIKSLSGGVGFL